MFGTNVERTVLLGGPGTGKTERLAGRVADLLASGAAARDVLVLTANRAGTAEFAARLASRGVKGVRVATPREVALELLGCEDALASTGRKARLLTDFEWKILLADLQTSGMDQKRMGEMLKFFYRGWTELRDEEEDWFVSTEEERLHALIKETLAFESAMLEYEVAAFAVRYLRSLGEKAAKLGAAHVVMDDAHLFERAEQILGAMLAKSSVWAAGNPLGGLRGEDDYPYAAGLSEMAETGATVEKLETSRRSEAVRAVLNNVAAGSPLEGEELVGAEGAPQGRFEAVCHDNPKAEMDAVAALVADAVKNGTAPEKICVVTWNGYWPREIAARLAEAGVPAATVNGWRWMNGDTRYVDTCAPAQAFAVLSLVADDADMLAWRDLFAFGDYLSNSLGLRGLRQFSEGDGIGAIEALRRLKALVEGGNESTVLHALDAQGCGAETQGGLLRIAACYRDTCTLLKQLRGLEGRELVDAVCQAVGVEDDLKGKLADLLEADRCGDPVQMAARGRAKLASPGFAGSEGAVRIGSLYELAGYKPELLVVTCFVNGSIPKRSFFDQSQTSRDRQEAEYAKDVRKMYALVSGVQSDLVVTHFAMAPHETADRMGFNIERIRLKKGVPAAVLAPSMHLALMQGKATTKTWGVTMGA